MKEWQGEDGRLYPAGTKGELAVGYYREGDDLPALFPAATREEADAMFADFLKAEMPMRVILESGPHEGRRSPVVFIVRCDGGENWDEGTNWLVIKETEGTRQEIPDGRLDIPDLKLNWSIDDLLK